MWNMHIYLPRYRAYVRSVARLLGCMAFGALSCAYACAATLQAAAQQSAAVSPNPPAATNGSPSTIPIDSIRPALGQVTSTLDRVQINHWKISRDLKRQMHSDVDSIQQDISSQVPGLLAKAQAAPKEIAPQLAVMQNVNALYDVLVRVSTAATLGGNKADSGALEDALQGLESSRKTLSDQLLRAAAFQDQRIVQMQALMPQNAGQVRGQGKTIIVDNDGRHRVKRRKPMHRKKPTPANVQSAPKTPAPN